MTIKSIINNWYKELFWMGVGAAITLATEKVVRTIKDKKREEEVKEAFQKFAHDAEELRKATRGQKEPEMEVEEPDSGECGTDEDGLEADPGVPAEDEEPITKVCDLMIISQEEFEDMQSGPDCYNRFELVYDPENCLFGYENGIDQTLLEDNADICNLFHSKGAMEWIIDTLCDGKQSVIYGALSNGDVYICVRLGSVEEVK